MNSLGVQFVRKLYKVLNINEEWSLADDRGFTWWGGHHFAQRIWAGQPIDDDGFLVTKVTAETDFLKYPTRSIEIEAILANEMVRASLSGLVVDQKDARIRLRCSVYVHEENHEWLGRIFSLAVLMQVFEAESRAEILAMILGLQLDRSCHPDSGVRNEVDEMLNFVPQIVIPEGNKPFDSIGDFEFRRTADILNSQNLVSTASETGLAAYSPFANDTALLQADTDQEHPELGKGLLIRLSLPPEKVNSRIDGRLIMDMNSKEQNSQPSGHFLGSWCLGPIGKNVQTPVYVTFIPAVACSPGILSNMCVSTLCHGKWAEEYLGLSKNEIDFNLNAD